MPHEEKGSPAQQAQRAAAIAKAQEANRLRRAAEKEQKESAEAVTLRETLADLPEGEPSPQERTWAKLIARETVNCDRLSAMLEYRRSNSQAVSKLATELARSTRNLADLHKSLQAATALRVASEVNTRAGKPVLPKRDPKHVDAVARILAASGLGHSDPRISADARALAERMNEHDAQEGTRNDDSTEHDPASQGRGVPTRFGGRPGIGRDGSRGR